MLKKKRHWERLWRSSDAYQIVEGGRARQRLSRAKARLKAEMATDAA